MNKQQARSIFWKVFFILVIFGTSLNFWHTAKVETTTVAVGYIENKRAVEYDCGSAKSPATCVDYMLTVNRKEHEVTSIAFNENTVGDYVSLTQTSTSSEDTAIEAYKFVSTLISVILVSFELLIFLYWFLFCDTLLTYREWRSIEVW